MLTLVRKETYHRDKVEWCSDREVESKRWEYGLVDNEERGSADVLGYVEIGCAITDIDLMNGGRSKDGRCWRQ